jgi:ParB/RepB/Spo0J family partition protein
MTPKFPAKIPTKYQSDYKQIKAAIKAGLYESDIEARQIIDAFIDMVTPKPKVKVKEKKNKENKKTELLTKSEFDKKYIVKNRSSGYGMKTFFVLKKPLSDTAKHKFEELKDLDSQGRNKDLNRVFSIENQLKELSYKVYYKSGSANDKVRTNRQAKEQAYQEYLKDNTKKPVGKTKTKRDNTVVKISTNKVFTDEKRFQNRKKLNENTLNQIIENFNAAKFDAPVVWLDPTNGKTYILAGHHRLEAIKRMGKKTIPVKYLDATEQEAIKYAKVESNANRTLETPLERSNIYRLMRENGETKKAIEKQAEIEGKNKRFILNLSHLNEKGLTYESLERFVDTNDVQGSQIIEKIGDWIGEARRGYADLTNAHENEMFNFLQNKDASKRINTKVDFIQKINSIVSAFDFDPSQPLNLKRYKYETEGEKVYNKEYQEIKEKIEVFLNKNSDIKDRFSNPKNPNFIDPKKKDYDAMLTQANLQMAKNNDSIKALQSKLINLQRNKSNYIKSGATQTALFGKASKKKSKKHLGTVVFTASNQNAPSSVVRGNTTGADLGQTTPPSTPETTSKIRIAKPRQTSELVQSLTKAKQAAANASYFALNGEMAKFLGQLEKKNTHSVVITLDAPAGSGKTRGAFQFVNMAANAGLTTIFVSLEEHPESKLFTDKANQYIAPNNHHLIDVQGDLPKTYQEFLNTIEQYDVIVVDSWNKVFETFKVDFDNDLRKKLHGKLIFTIFQRTTNGTMRGGAKAAFDGDVILEVVKHDDYRDNYIQARKNRYQHLPLHEIGYNVYYQKTINPSQQENINNEVVIY